MLMKLMVGVASIGTILGVGVAIGTATAADAEATACWGQITQMKGKNYTGCGMAHHFNRINNKDLKYGNNAKANTWSYEPLCYANVTQYGMVRV
ncbi:hypothetical protein [Curtobacterium herbarum]|uniref:hypothetical protein n=1 Tax=Curtobacterium herbarum TaxID=150122 RepID=UPI001C8DC10A|nr:hypothetical protein [Curtobacterium herbarum]MBY0177825.1 hypothetical protein [Curtobacterium herbarum]